MGRQTPLDLKGDPLGTPVPTEPHCCLELPTPAPRSRCEDLEPEFKVRPMRDPGQSPSGSRPCNCVRLPAGTREGAAQQGRTWCFQATAFRR